LDAFIGGLKPDIRAFVKAFRPQILEDAFEQALNLEGTVDIQLKKLKFQPRPVPIPTQVRSSQPTSPTTSNIIEQRRVLGLCRLKTF
jgi:hypothetical protein